MTAVCHTTAWLPYSRHASRRCRPRGTGTPRAAGRRRCPSPRCRRTSCRACGGRARPGRAAPRPRTSRGATSTCADADLLLARRGPGRRTSSATPMKSAPRPYLNVTRLQSTQRGMSSTSSCSTFTHSTGPMPSGKTNVSGSLKRSVVNQPVAFSQMTRRVQALLDRGPDRERGRELVAVDRRGRSRRGRRSRRSRRTGGRRRSGRTRPTGRARRPCPRARAGRPPPTARPWRTGRRPASRRSARRAIGVGRRQVMAMSM